jgi:mannitol-specific phosphotransferase system IIBC component
MTPRIMSIPSSHHGTAAGTAGGTLLSVFATIESGDLTKTIVLATVGAVVSFGVSLGLKWLAKKLRRVR